MDFTLKNKTDITGTHWIEFNISGTTNDFTHWADNSKYLDEYAYNFYTDIFEENISDFNYYGDTKLDKEKLITIVQKIENKIKTVDALQTVQDIITFCKKTSNALDMTQEIEDICKKDGQFNILISDMKQLGHNLIALFDKCIKENKTLWILGL